MIIMGKEVKLIMNKINEIKNKIKDMMEDDYSSFIKALFSIESGIDDLETLNEMYDKYMEVDDYTLISTEILEVIQVK